MIFVTGASGNVGREVMESLKKLKADYRIGVRTREKSKSKENTVIFDFLDPKTFGAAVEGCTSVFLLRPPAISNTKATLNLFIDAARQGGVQHFVFVSVAGAATNPLVPHHSVEKHLMSGPADWTILRPGFFAQNLGDAYRIDICIDSRLYLPAGSARVAFIDVRDIAAVAGMALTNSTQHRAKAYLLTGPEALSFSEVATILTNILGRRIIYQHASIIGYMAHLLTRKLPMLQILIQTILHVGLRFGQAQSVDPTLEQLLERKPYTVADYARVNQTLWRNNLKT